MSGQFDLEDRDDDEELEEETEQEEQEEESNEESDSENEDDDEEDDDEGSEDSSEESTGESGATAGAEKKSSKMVPLEAVKDERRKRQALERRLELMEARLQGVDAGRGAATEKKEEEPDLVITDEEFLTEPSKALAKQRAVDAKRREDRSRERIFQRDLEDASLLFDDFEEVFTDEHIQEWRSSTPGAEALVGKSQAPVKLAYRGIKKMLKERERSKSSEADETLRAENEELKKKLESIEKRLGKPTRGLGRRRSTTRRHSADEQADSPFRNDW